MDTSASMSLPEGQVPACVVAASRSGAGKTSIAVGIMAALQALGWRVQGYKVGPDYLDPMYHTLATGRPSRNLDSYLMPREALLGTFWRGLEGADAAVVEGVMGLYDGRLDSPPQGSTAEVARLLDLPVLLVLDVAGQSQTAAAVALGLIRYPDAPTMLGIVLNRVGSSRHAEAVTKELERTARIPVLGAVPRDGLPHLPERHLGLVPAGELAAALEAVQALGEALRSYVDLEGIVRLSLRPRRHTGPQPARPSPLCTIAVARDSAFNFYYEDNLDLLKNEGAQIVEFSPLSDPGLPPGAQGVYLGGGYPELFAAQLSENQGMLASIRAACAEGLPIYAECGGLMYLCRGIEDIDGRRFETVGLLGAWAKMERTRARLAYVEVETATASWLGPAGIRLRGHEYHWSRLTEELRPPLYRYLRPGTGWQGAVAGPEGNLVASYVHLHFAGAPELARRFVEACSRAGRRADP